MSVNRLSSTSTTCKPNPNLLHWKTPNIPHLCPHQVILPFMASLPSRLQAVLQAMETNRFELNTFLICLCWSPVHSTVIESMDTTSVLDAMADAKSNVLGWVLDQVKAEYKTKMHHYMVNFQSALECCAPMS
jgi:hypothetical protein